MLGKKKFFTPEEEKQLVEAIEAAEKNTSGEIKIHVDKYCKINPYIRAVDVFEKTGMTDTELRNGVLFYIATEDHKFAIAGDEGINAKVPEGFWDNVKEHVLTKFKEGKYADGLSEGIGMAGEQLKTYFPYQSDDINELPDDISYGEGDSK